MSDMKDNWLEILLNSRLACACLIAFFSFTLPSAGYSQTQNLSTNQNKEIEPSVVCALRFDVELVIVEVEIKDRQGQYVSNLKHGDFVVYDNGKKQKVEFCLEEKESDVGVSSIKYKIGYYPPEDLQAGELRRIRVRVRDTKKQGMTVQYDPIVYIWW
jgi:hypothetical protein